MNNRRMITRDSKARNILEISKAMTDWKISKSSVAITDEKGKQVIGILTERDDDVIVNIALQRPCL
jgi:hypothetical protein